MSEESKSGKSRVSNKLKREIDSTLDKITRITRHIRNVEDNCVLLGTKLISAGQIELGKQLIANGFVHDVSKFSGIEFEFMAPGTPTVEDQAKLKLKLAIYNHQKTNLHHPEAWSGGIKDMADVYTAEIVCDWKSRSQEFGTNLREWITTWAMKKWNFTENDEVYKKIMTYVDLICETPFEQIQES
jgi:hypothetical protein